MKISVPCSPSDWSVNWLREQQRGAIIVKLKEIQLSLLLKISGAGIYRCQLIFPLVLLNLLASLPLSRNIQTLILTSRPPPSTTTTKKTHTPLCTLSNSSPTVGQRPVKGGGGKKKEKNKTLRCLYSFCFFSQVWTTQWFQKGFPQGDPAPWARAHAHTHTPKHTKIHTNTHTPTHTEWKIPMDELTLTEADEERAESVICSLCSPVTSHFRLFTSWQTSTYQITFFFFITLLLFLHTHAQTRPSHMH